MVVASAVYPQVASSPSADALRSNPAGVNWLAISSIRETIPERSGASDAGHDRPGPECVGKSGIDGQPVEKPLACGTRVEVRFRFRGTRLVEFPRSIAWYSAVVGQRSVGMVGNR